MTSLALGLIVGFGGVALLLLLVLALLAFKRKAKLLKAYKAFQEKMTQNEAARKTALEENLKKFMGNAPDNIKKGSDAILAAEKTYLAELIKMIAKQDFHKIESLDEYILPYSNAHLNIPPPVQDTTELDKLKAALADAEQNAQKDKAVFIHLYGIYNASLPTPLENPENWDAEKLLNFLKENPLQVPKPEVAVPATPADVELARALKLLNAMMNEYTKMAGLDTGGKTDMTLDEIEQMLAKKG